MPGSYLQFLLPLTKQKLSHGRKSQCLITNLCCPIGKDTFCHAVAAGLRALL